MKKHFFLASLAMTALVGLLAGCSQKEEYKEPEINPDDPALVTYDYSILIPAANEAQAVLLRDFTKPVYKIDNPAQWVTVEVSDQTLDGFQVLNVISNQANKDLEATVTIKSEAREEIKLLVLQGKVAGADAGGNADFYTDWENFSTIKINGKANPVATPWMVESQNNIPLELAEQYKKEHGWEMAFCSLNNTATDRLCYFGLYNKYNGTLRVFHYLNDPTGYGQEISYQVWMGSQSSSNNAPYYNSFELGIPANHSFDKGNLNKNSNFVGNAKQSQPFMTWVTPYMRFSNSLVEGWYCFDLDMSGYIPGGTQWRDVSDNLKMSIVPVIRNTQDITLRGTLAGDLGGTFDNPQTIQKGTGNCLSGVCGILNMAGGMMSGQLGTASQYAMTLSQPGTMAAKMGSGSFYGGLAMSTASSILGIVGDLLTTEEPEYQYIPGRIDMKLDAQLDLSGTISNYTSSKEAIFNVSKDNINTTNGDAGHFGRGIWGLAEDPIVYVDADDLLADYDHFTIYNKFDGKNQYYSSDFNSYGVRYVYFLDPASVKLNINTDLFPDVQNVTMSTVCGVYPSRQSGYADAYRSFLCLDNPEFKLATGTFNEVLRLGPNSKPRIIKLSPRELLATGPDEYETVANSKKVQQKGASHSYYGYVVNAGNKDIIVNPQIYMNITQPNGHINNPRLPSDLIVSVQITFEANNSTFIFTKCFVPRIVMISHEETMQKYEQMLDFFLNPVTNLANAPSVKVKHPRYDIHYAKPVHMLGLVKAAY